MYWRCHISYDEMILNIFSEFVHGACRKIFDEIYTIQERYSNTVSGNSMPEKNLLCTFPYEVVG